MSHLLVGAADATMAHGEAWHFSRLGRLIERADKTSRIVDVMSYLLLPTTQDVGSPLDVVRWTALLNSASALEMYRRQHGKIVPEKVADFFILDTQFPRSMHFCLIKAQESLQQITGSVKGTFRNRAEQRMGRLRSTMDYTSIKDVIREGLHEYIDALQCQINLLCADIRDDFFTPHGSKRTTDDAEVSQFQSS